jgi:hypothetical protein
MGLAREREMRVARTKAYFILRVLEVVGIVVWMFVSSDRRNRMMM